MSFHVGQKVVFISFDHEDPDPPKHLETADLNEGAVYTIRDIDLRTLPYHGVATIRLEEITNRIINVVIYGKWELGYHPRNFRPLVEHKTDISVFQKIARDVTARPPVKVKTREVSQ